MKASGARGINHIRTRTGPQDRYYMRQVLMTSTDHTCRDEWDATWRWPATRYVRDYYGSRFGDAPSPRRRRDERVARRSRGEVVERKACETLLFMRDVRFHRFRGRAGRSEQEGLMRPDGGRGGDLGRRPRAS